jgi:alpha-galactosidase/6-phospho-beta-glucosidase family protein
MHHLKPARTPYGRRPCPQIIQDWTYGPQPVGDLHLLTGEHAHELMWSYLTGEPFTRVLNLLNDGPYINGLPKTACIEAKVTVQGRKVTGKPITLPPAIHALVTDWTTIHELSFQAAMKCDRALAKQALFLDPHMTDLYDIEPLLEDMLEATKPWLPGKWFK